MRLPFGFEITRAKAAPSGLQSPSNSGGWWSIVREPFTGAWQRNIEWRKESVLTFGAVYSCVTLIASDIGKLRPKLVEQDNDGIWNETESAAFSPVLRKPNRYQNRIKFYEHWIVSKLLAGNTYVLKQRDERKVVTALYILDPNRTRPLIAPDGAVYYELSRDNLSGVDQDRVVVPASEIIHDVMVPLFHPLCGVTPLTACGAAAAHGMTIQTNQARFFENNSRPSGILVAPKNIDKDNAERLKALWEQNYTGTNAGKVAILGDGLTYTPLSINAVDSELIEQLKWDERNVCTAFHVPGYMVGVGDPPQYNNIDALREMYYQQCLQALIEAIEICLDEGLGLTEGGKRYGAEFDLDDLLRMDSATKVKTAVEGLKGIFTPNEARKKFDLKPKAGGDAVYMQQQNFSIEALNKRDQSDDPFAKAPAPQASGRDGDRPPANDDDPEALAAASTMAAWAMKSYFDKHAV